MSSDINVEKLSSLREGDHQGVQSKGAGVDSVYARYVLFVLVLMAVMNFIDRQILSILAEDIKADLGLSDGDLGFLFGTAFAVFYAVFGIPLGCLADSWNRTKQISISVGFWSLMTAASGLAKGLVPLSLCRFGVGIGEAGASPAALSIIYDYFSPKHRTTVMGIYTSGVSIGAGIGLFLGGAILTGWNGAWPDHTMAPLGLKGWQAAFMAVGLPGLLLAALIRTLKEPLRGQAEGLQSGAKSQLEGAPRKAPWKVLLREALPMMPFVNQWIFMKEGASFRVRVSNIIVGLLVALVATTLKALTGDTVQWYALGIGFYCAFSWAQLLVCRDKACFGMIFRCKTLRYVYLYVGLNTFTVSAIGFWTVPWLLRYYNVDAAGVGLAVGLSVAGSGLLGMISGGVLADRLRHHTQYGKLYVAIGTTCLAVLAKGMMLLTHDVAIIYGLIFLAGLVGSAGTAPAASTVSDLVIPRVRAIAMALVAMVNYFMGVALGPYSVGLLSDHLMASGVTSGEALRIGMLWSLVPMGCSIILLLLALKHLVKDEDSRLERARSFGEPI